MLSEWNESTRDVLAQKTSLTMLHLLLAVIKCAVHRHDTHSSLIYLFHLFPETRRGSTVSQGAPSCALLTSWCRTGDAVDHCDTWYLQNYTMFLWYLSYASYNGCSKALSSDPIFYPFPFKNDNNLSCICVLLQVLLKPYAVMSTKMEAYN